MTADYTQLSNTQIVGLTIWGESRDQPIDGQIAVGCVIRNRMRLGDGWKNVCLKPAQFSCFNADSEERVAMLAMAQVLTMADPPLSDVMRQCLWIAQGIIGGALIDNTKQATHYLTKGLFTTHPPLWALGVTPLATIGQHVFLRVA